MPNMKRLNISLLLIAAFGIAQAQLEPNSFIRRPTPTLELFIAHVKSDPIVMDRYMRHYHMTRDEVIAYLSVLRKDRLPKTTRMVVYNVPDSGVLRSRILTLRQGTEVWVDLTGRPVIKVSCGNPFDRGPKAPEQVARVEPAVATLPSATTSLVAEIMPEESDVVLLTQEPPVPIEPTVVTPPVVVEPPAVEPPAQPPVEEPPVVVVNESAAPFSFPGWLFAPLPLLFLGGGGGGTTPPVVPPVLPPSPPVPEPATALALLAGLGFLSARRRR